MSRTDSRPDRRESLDRLVAEHEVDMAVSDLAAPAAHRRGGDLFVEQTIGDLCAVEVEGR
jgi:hypothetical protein